MIKHLHIEGFKSLVNIDLPLRPLNVLIGPNGAGKTNLLDVLYLLTYGAQGILSEGLKGHGGVRTLRTAITDQPSTMPVRLSVELVHDDSVLSYDVALNDLGTLTDYVSDENLLRLSSSDQQSEILLGRRDMKALFWNRSTKQTDSVDLQQHAELAITQTKHAIYYPEATFVQQTLGTIQRYGNLSTGPRQPARLPQVAASQSALFPDGMNLTNVLAMLMGNDQFKEDFDAYLRNLFPDFKRLHFPPLNEGRITLQWYSRCLNRSLNIWELSDGIINCMILLCVLLNPNRPAVICIDEPEVGLHPQMMAIVADLIKAASEHTQLLVMTHSPELVNHFEPDDIVVVESEKGQTSTKRLDQASLANWLQEFSTGELFRMGQLEQG